MDLPIYLTPNVLAAHTAEALLRPQATQRHRLILAQASMLTLRAFIEAKEQGEAELEADDLDRSSELLSFMHQAAILQGDLMDLVHEEARRVGDKLPPRGVWQGRREDTLAALRMIQARRPPTARPTLAETLDHLIETWGGDHLRAKLEERLES
jgi:hypothetical protein